MTAERVDNVDPSKNASWKLPTKRCAQADPIECDVLIIGSGFLGCTFVRKILENGSTREKSIIIIDVGSQLSKNPGENIKNSIFFQRHISRSTPDFIHSFRHILSVPEDKLPASLDPNVYRFNASDYPGYVQGGRNPDQVPEYNLENSSVTYAIGGMATHWTACTPRQNKEIERSTIFSDQEWNDIYVEAESLLHTRNDVFDASIRQQAIFQVLKQDPMYADLISPLPVAATKLNDDPFLVRWTGADTVLGDHLIQRINNNDNKLRILSQHLCMCLNTEINIGTSKNNVISATIKDCIQNKTFDINAKFFVVAAGAVLTPQVLFASKIERPALGKYLCDHPNAFCQIVYSKEIVDLIAASNPDREENSTYPVPVPVNDPNPRLIIPVTKDHPWQGIILKDSFTMGGIIANVDSRLTLDLNWFSSSQPNPNNMVTFSESNTDLFGMPQPTFHFKLSDEDTNIAEMMMAEMRDVATKLGGYLPGVEPSLLKPGTALHITGTTRMGDITKTDVNPDEYVVDKNSTVIGFDNLYIGSCGVIPTGTACNPTLTAIAIACYACKDLISKLEKC